MLRMKLFAASLLYNTCQVLAWSSDHDGFWMERGSVYRLLLLLKYILYYLLRGLAINRSLKITHVKFDASLTDYRVNQ